MVGASADKEMLESQLDVGSQLEARWLAQQNGPRGPLIRPLIKRLVLKLHAV